jgi:hypothetical protein
MNSISTIEVVYFTQTKIIEKKSFDLNVKFQEIIDFFNSNIKRKNKNLQLKTDYYFQNTELTKSTVIIDLFNENINPNNDKLNIYIELTDKNEPNVNKSVILKPKNDPFGIVSYSVNTNTLLSEDFDNTSIESNNLDKYNPEYSTYCYSNNTLYISGGIEENSSEPLNDFWIINYSSDENQNYYEIKHLEMPIGKKEHSMIYNKDDNSIIIVGGNDKKCLVYDIKNETFSEFPETNDKCLKPALIIKNNCLYVFDSFDRKKKYFEKIELDKKNKFQKFSPKNYFLQHNIFYGVCDTNNDDQIMICGGERTGTYTVIYKIKYNSLIKTSIKDVSIKLNDKSFYKIDRNYYINIPHLKKSR